ncbi:hypothetical protein DT603_06215 [Pseudoxanthomonas gei]|uniref:Uncharacterized protein n=1 Tax=Pseudoxanthomonas gei TaxID=1383030 RepID=A0ABX0AAC7_9GAMM|nr:hypothetical protein [Pseudoxanthomonas gei]
MFAYACVTAENHLFCPSHIRLFVAYQDKEVPIVPSDSLNTIHPPSPSSLLYLVYQKDGDGASSYEMESGSWVSYWYGYSFELGGEQYFTGFTAQTPDEYAASPHQAGAAPDPKVTIGQATVVIAHPPNRLKPWLFQGSDQFVGELGGFAKPNEIDEGRAPQSHVTVDGKLLLAVPTWYLATGTRISTFDLFLFNPHELNGADERRWTYLGNLVAGAHNGAACEGEEEVTIPCATSTGSLEFLGQETSGLPVIRVIMSGTQVRAAGETRALGPGDTVEYRYDTSSKQYL